jgi:mRNA interferase MazF
MRSIVLAQVSGKVRPAVVLTRTAARHNMTNVTVAPITSTIRGLSTEVLVGSENGLDHESVVSCDDITTVRSSDLGRQVGYLLDWQEHRLAEAIQIAFDLEN